MTTETENTYKVRVTERNSGKHVMDTMPTTESATKRASICLKSKYPEYSHRVIVVDGNDFVD